jgi:hypothetical protein
MTASVSGTLKKWSEASRHESLGTYLSPSLEFCLEFCESIDPDLNIYASGVRLMEVKLEDSG